MESEELRKLIASGESEVLEFKLDLPNIRNLAVMVSAFANTDGGKLIVGIRDDGDIIGLKNIEQAELQVERALTVISPPVDAEIETAILNDKSVLVITVPKGSQSPYLVAGQAFQRYGPFNVHITSQTLYSNIKEHVKSPDDFLVEIKRLSEVIAEMNANLVLLRSWKSKIPDMVIGGIIGAIVTLLISSIFSL